MSNPNDYTVGWICAISTESAAAKTFLDEIHEKPKVTAAGDNNSYTLGRIGDHKVVIAVLPDGEYGISSAATVATNMSRSYLNLRFALMVGIGGGAPSPSHDIRLGDIVVSGSRRGTGGVFQYDFGRAIQDQGLHVTSVLNLPPACLRTAIADLRSRHKMLGYEYEVAVNTALEKYPRMRREFSRPNHLSDKLYRSTVIHPRNNMAKCEEICGNNEAAIVSRPDRTEDENNPAIHYGPIASANRLMMDSKIRDKFAAEKGVLCFEMEAAGIMNQFPCLVIRGICDYSDTHRNKEWQGYAAMTAAAYAKELLYEVTIKSVEAERRMVDILSQVAITVDSIKYQLDKREDVDVLDWITPSEYGPQQSDFINRKQTGTCQWLLDSTVYKTWLTESNQTLFCPGIPGAGKTILTAVVIDDLITQTSNNMDIGLAYIYCNFKQQSIQMFKHLAASLLKQLGRKKPFLPDCVKQLYYTHQKARTKPTERELVDALQSVAATYSKIFIVIDALDECEVSDGSRTKILSVISNLRSHATINFLATSRYIPDIESQLKPNLKLEIMASDGDMRRYIDANMQNLPSFLSLGFGIEEEIKALIVRAAQGMFLLVYLWIKSLMSKTSISEIKSFLRALHNRNQENLSETGLRDALYQAYNEAMERIDCQGGGWQTLGRRVISWITCARRPLMKLELQYALAVKNKDIMLDKDNIRDMDIIVSVCAGLVTVDEESGIVRLVHHTTQEYFNQTQNQWLPDFESDITRVCCIYLSFSTFEKGFCQTEEELSNRLQSNPFYNYAAVNWGHHARNMEEISQEVIDFITCRAKVEASCQVLMAHHVYNGDEFLGAEIKRTTGLHLVGFFGIPKMLQFLPHDRQYLELVDIFGVVPLQYAVINKHEDTIRQLLEKGAAVDSLGPGEVTALTESVMEGNESIARLLLDYGADIETEDEYGCTPLHNAIEFEEIIKLLLSRGAKIDATDGSGNTPLLLAAKKGKEDAVQLLLQKGASADAKDNSGQTALIHAVLENHERIVRLLLEGGALVEERDALGRTPLFLAAEIGHINIFQLLFEKSADDQAKDMHGRKPLFHPDWKFTFKHHSTTTRK